MVAFGSKKARDTPKWVGKALQLDRPVACPSQRLSLREALKEMGRMDLIGNGKHHLVPRFQPATDQTYHSPRKKNSDVEPGVSAKTSIKKGRILTQHTGLPPRQQMVGAGMKPAGRK